MDEVFINTDRVKGIWGQDANGIVEKFIADRIGDDVLVIDRNGQRKISSALAISEINKDYELLLNPSRPKTKEFIRSIRPKLIILLMIVWNPKDVDEYMRYFKTYKTWMDTNWINDELQLWVYEQIVDGGRKNYGIDIEKC